MGKISINPALSKGKNFRKYLEGLQQPPKPIYFLELVNFEKNSIMSENIMKINKSREVYYIRVYNMKVLLKIVSDR